MVKITGNMSYMMILAGNCMDEKSGPVEDLETIGKNGNQTRATNPELRFRFFLGVTVL